MDDIIKSDRLHFAPDGRGNRAVFLDGTEVKDVLAAFVGGNEQGWVEVCVRDHLGHFVRDGDAVQTEIRTGMVRVDAKDRRR